MKKQNFEISGSYRGIPAILWGESERRIYVAVHGRCGNKEDEQIRCFAEMAVNNGFSVLSFDLPQHGQRQQEEGALAALMERWEQSAQELEESAP